MCALTGNQFAKQSDGGNGEGAGNVPERRRSPEPREHPVNVEARSVVHVDGGVCAEDAMLVWPLR